MLIGIFVSASKLDEPPDLTGALWMIAASLFGLLSSYIVAYIALLLTMWIAPHGQVTPDGFLPIFFDWQNRLLE
jgi:hypothetical protein